MTDARGNVTWTNAEYLELTGYTANELLGQPAGDFAFDELSHASPSSQPWLSDTVCQRKTGEAYTARHSVTVLRDKAGKVTGFWITRQDITGLQLDRHAPQYAQENLSALIESTEDIVWSVDLNYKLVTFNSAFYRAFERTFGVRAAVGMGPEDLLPPERAALWPPLFERALSEGPFRAEYPLLDGRTLEMALNRIVHDGKTIGFSGFGKDITERKIAEKALLDAAKKYRDLFEGALEGIYRTSINGSMLEANPALARMVGYDSAQDIVAAITDLAHQVWPSPNERAQYLELLERDGVVRGYECQLKRKDGTAVWVSVNGRKVCGPDGRTLYTEGFVEDIGERKRTEAALQQAYDTIAQRERHYRLIFNSGSDVVFIHAIGKDGLPGPFLEVNDHGCRLLERTREELLRMSVLDIIPAEEHPFVPAIARRLMAEGRLVWEGAMVAKSGRRIPVEINCHLFNLDGSPTMISSVRDITERKRTEKALRNSEEKFAKAFQCSPAVITLSDLGEGSRLVEVNDAFEQVTGYLREEAVGRSAEELGLWADPREFDDSVMQSRDTGRLRSFEHHFRKKNGGIGIGLTSAEPIELDGRPFMISATLDITERREAQARLQAHNRRFQSIIESTDAGYFRIGMDGCFEDVNPAWLRMHGFTRREEAVGLHFSAVQTPGDTAKAEAIAEALMRGESVRSGEFSRLRQDGTTGYHSFSANSVLDGDRVIGVEGFLVDLTERKTAEQRYRSLFDSMHEGVAVHRLTFSGGVPDNYMLLDVNRRFEEIVGVRREDVIDRLATDVYRVPAPPYLKEYAAAVQANAPLRFETYFKPMDKHFSISVAPIGDDRFATIFFDVTQQKKTAEAMRSLVTAIEQTGETIVITDLEGTIQYCNPAFEKVTGYTKEEAIGQNSRVLKSGKHGADFYEQLWATILQGKVWTGRMINRKKDGSFYEEDATISPIRDGSSEISGFVAVKRDVTERLQLERQFFQAQKLESVGRLAGGVAHDFNNLLTVINGYSDLLLRQMKVSDPLKSYAEEIKNAGEHAASLTKQLLAFSRKQVIRPTVLDLNHTIKESGSMLQRLIGEDIVLETHLSGSLGQVLADPDQIHQVIMNLAVNARDAMPDGGKLDITTGNVQIGQDSAASHPDATPGRYVLMTVTDTGHGMDQTIRDQIFEPFFTTKESGKGTGLGLSTVYGIIRQGGGWIDVWSEVGVGTSFKIYLPRTDGCAPAPAEGTGAFAEGTGVTILVVEDQAVVRSFIESTLKSYGYRVLAASGGSEAIEVVTRYSGPIHLLLTDVVMPGMNGKDLSELLKELRPELKVLFTSGYTSDVLGRRGVLDDGMAYIPKPFSADSLTRKVLDVLGTAPQ
jgi:two-component system cell cycle sensor histidine kinase/response regulator CckA